MGKMRTMEKSYKIAVVIEIRYAKCIRKRGLFLTLYNLKTYLIITERRIYRKN